MVQLPNLAAPAEKQDFRMPYQPQSAQNLSVIAGLGGALVSSFATTYGLFAMASDPGLAWIGILAVWAAYAVTMAVLWFATASEAR